MTLIAYKDGVICADSQRQQGSLRSVRPYMKVSRRADGALFAASGYAAVSQAWSKWFLEGENGAPPWRDLGENHDDIAIVAPCGTVKLWAGAELPENVNGDPLALGWPSYLQGLMDAGLSATEAVKTACRRYTGAGYPLIEMRHAGDPVVWVSETERGDPAEFFKACGLNQEDYIQKQRPKLAAANVITAYT